tara:strand:+ start:894 stop:1496 length:603 start_codon:yes stop_codon:yes gene_type:complete
MFKKNLENYLDTSNLIKKNLINSQNEIQKSIKKIFVSIKRGGKILICGNGGSAADAQHLAAEFLIRLRPKINRKGIPAISLAQDTSTITACSNDYDFNIIFSRNLETLGSKKDILLALSTSGNSKNIYEALKTSKKMKIYSIGFYGNRGGKCKKITDTSIVVDSSITSYIQEAQITLGHFIFREVEELLLAHNKNSKKFK